MPKVSVILTSFNHAKYLREAIDSVLGQTFSDFELIIWDDASKDDSWSIIQGYRDPRIKAFRNDEQRRGIYGINKAISEVAQGECIAIHHSDDAWEPDKLSRQVEFLENNKECGAVFTNALAVGEDSLPLQDASHYYKTIFAKENRTRHQWLNYFFYHMNALCHPSALIRKKCFEECGLYRHGFGQLGDYEMWVRLCLKFEIYVLPEEMVRFRVRQNEANTSGNRPDVRKRVNNEYYHILDNYHQVSSLADLKRIFPEGDFKESADGFMPEYVFSRWVLNRDMGVVQKAHALNTLYRVLLDRSLYDRAHQLYGFSYEELIDISGEVDSFSAEALAERDRIIAERDSQIADLKAHLNGILQSNSWRLTKPFRYVRRVVARQHSAS